MPDTDEVLAERRESVLLLTLNRPARLNAWTPSMRDRYVELLARADLDERVRAIVVAGAGGAFCAGADLSAPPAPDARACGAGGEPLLAAPMRTGKPVIAALHGTVAGNGLTAALFADVRFSSREATLTTAFSRRDLTAERGVAWLLPKLVGVGTALDLMLSARTLRGDEAGEAGLVDRVVEDEDVREAALTYARTLATECSPDAMAETKHQVYAGLDSGLEVAAHDGGMLTSLGRRDAASGAPEPRHEPRAPRRDR